MQVKAERVYTPSELNREVKLHLEAGFPRIAVEGEISNLARPASGHVYFSLKDDRSQLRCAMFRSAVARSGLRIDNGLLVSARGKLSLYEARGEYQFIVESMQEAGEGLLQRRFEELKKRLEQEGLFDPARKKPLPAYPSRIGLVTSSSGAAVRDLLQVLGRRWPVAQVRVYPVLVQGEEAPGQIRHALAAANQHAWADLLIVGRGGGSLEDLWAFNDEGVARAVADSGIPVVSAVGHETDFSICDFVADLRAATPSAAAELATPDGLALNRSFQSFERQMRSRIEDRLRQSAQGLDHLAHRLRQRHPSRRLSEQARMLDGLSARMQRSLSTRIRERRLRLDGLRRRLDSRRPDRRLKELAQRLAELDHKLKRQAALRLGAERERVASLARTLHAVSPLQTISRGFSVLTGPDGQVVSRIEQVRKGDKLHARISDGELGMTVDAVRGTDEE